MANKKHALGVTRAQDFSAWYQAVVSGADLAENAGIRGCMVIKPYGFAIWERIQRILDDRFKELGYSNAYFPLFIPIDLFEKEAEHVAGFAKEMAIVTHHKLEQKDGKLVPSGKLETPLAVRPTSELIIGQSIANWIKSYRDLPVRVNQWCNVVRWEMRTRIFLRTSEFLWQEGHSAYEREDEAKADALRMHEIYKWFIFDVLKMSGITGKKPEYDKFAGAIDTYTVESMMQDGKALQSATSHYLGQNFAKAVKIQFQGRDGQLYYAHTTSFGLSTRLIGGIIMSHSDDDGLNLPSEIAPFHIVIIPMNNDEFPRILEYCHKVQKAIPLGIRSFIDTKEQSPQNKKWDYVRKGVPFILEIGMKEIVGESVCFTKRLSLTKQSLSLDEFIGKIQSLIKEHDELLKARCEDFVNARINRDLKTKEDLKEFFQTNKNPGFVIAKWSGENNGLDILDDISVSIRCVPTAQSGSVGKCILTGKDASTDVVFAKSY